MFKQNYQKKNLENNLAIKHLFVQSLFLARIFIGKQFYVMGKILYWESRDMTSRLGSVVTFLNDLGRVTSLFQVSGPQK